MFISQSNFIFKEVEEKISKNGNPFKLVKVIDTDNYQHLEFFGDQELKVSCQQNAKCKLVLVARKNGYQTAFACQSVLAI